MITWVRRQTMKSFALTLAIATTSGAETIRSISTFAMGQAVTPQVQTRSQWVEARFGLATQMGPIRRA